MRAIPVLAMISTLVSGCASPQPSTDTFPFGLSKFHWLMTSKEASGLYLAVAPRLPNSAAPYATNQSGVFLGPYKWRDCTLTVIFWFGYANSNLVATGPPSRFRLMDEMRYKPIDPSIDALTSIEVRMPDDMAASPSCLRDFQQEIGSHFEAGSPAGKTASRTDWKTPTTDAFSVQMDFGRGPTAWLIMFGHDARGPIIIN